MKTGEWKNTGILKVQEQSPLLKKSTIPCLYGGTDITITDSGQINEPEVLPILSTIPILSKVEFLNEKGEVLLQEKMLGAVSVSNILYGEKVKIKIYTENAEDGSTINFSLKNSQKTEKSPSLPKWKLKIHDNQCETKFFTVDINWYNEDEETYNYNSHITENKVLQEFYIEGLFNGESFSSQKLIPYTYRRNYEELIGLFSVDNSGNKNHIDNYENKFIGYNTKIKKIADGFIKFIKKGLVFSKDNKLTIEKIKKEVEKQAKSLWNKAVKQVQSGNLDDRPLYWARNKMQATLKRHPLFKEDIDYEKSLVKPNTELAKIIQIFEEKSRNYTGIDFSKAPKGTKKVLITGFDPFFLNSINHNEYKKYSNILQSNPSGIVSLNLSNNDTLGAYIQTMMIPTRYTDFDSSQENNKGQGEGIIEKYIKPFIDKVDMIITVSQALPGDYHIDVFATATRKGLIDNMNFTREDGSKSINNNSPETIKTTLPIQITKGYSRAIFWGNYNQKNKEIETADLGNFPKGKVYNGPGGNYLSNEIFYRVAKIREELKPVLPTGHFHISMIQTVGEDLDYSRAKELLNIVKTTLSEGFKSLY